MSIAGRIRVRFAGAEDLERCAAEDSGVPQDVIRRKLSQGEIVVAETDGQIVGYLRLEYLWSRVPYIGLIRVREEHRRQGTGRVLLGFLETYLRERGCHVLLSSSQVDEPTAQAWHQAMGFRECGILAGINEGGVGEVFFQKSLA